MKHVPNPGYVKVDTDPKAQAEGLLKYFPPTGAALKPPAKAEPPPAGTPAAK